jgi:nitrate reductase gamma subunit
LSDQQTTQLTYVTVAYAAMFYVAATVLIGGLAVKATRFLRKPPSLRTPTVQRPNPRAAATVRAATDMVLFRSTFFTDRVQWIFSFLFHFGLVLVLLRHLRYALDPSWVGSFVWWLVVLVQPLGLYGGLALVAGVAGFWARRLLIKEVRDSSSLGDHAVLALLLAIPVVGYLNNWVHTDVVQVKSFFVGLVTLHYDNLPTDALLLTHLWLVAMLMALLPFTSVLHLAGVFEKPEDDAFIPRANKRKLAIAVVVLAVLVAPAGLGISKVAQEGWTVPQPDFSRLARVHKNLDATVMIRNHPNFLMNSRSIVVYQGVRQDINRIEQCVTCHAVKGPDGQPVGYDDPKHFCQQCHYKAAVNIDCFECHNSKPMPDKKAALDSATKFAAIMSRTNERSSVR